MVTEVDELSVARKRLKVARENHERDYNELILALNRRESRLNERLSELNRKKAETAEANGNPDAADDDLVEVNAGGKIVVAKRSTLTQIKGTRLEAMFSGRWDKKLSRDTGGRIFLDVDPDCFQAIVDHLNERIISSEDSPPSPPSVDEEHEQILRQQIELFGLVSKVDFSDSSIIKDIGNIIVLHEWLKEDGSDGEFSLLYRGSRDGNSGSSFHSKCDNMGCTITIVETVCGLVLGGYSSTPWSSEIVSTQAHKAFLFALSGSGISSPCKMKLKSAGSSAAIANNPSHGPSFGFYGLSYDRGYDMIMNGKKIIINPGHVYHPGPLRAGTYDIKDIEVFQIAGSLPPARINTSKEKQAQDRTLQVEPVTRFSDDINKAINANHACLQQSEAEMLHLEASFNDEQTFIEKFASGDVMNVVVLNVSGTIMVTTRSTLCVAGDSVLAQQFDNSKWTEQGCSATRVKEWTPDQVSTWTKSVEGLPEEVGIILNENEITGRELLALSLDALKMMGIKRVGTVALLLKEIGALENASRDFVTLIEHSPYCFGKILGYLRLKRLHSLGLLGKEPALPLVCDSQKKRFEKVVKYYFPGDSAKFILGRPTVHW
ncbi:hypothetical protein ACHAW5_010218 [Stephanodiscus triporus]|uniref:TLDc domain-containing protein n=1 Tax=Stephanodiscus triporus TaxID=2934178 RepID=A0ABD3NQQ8_9STRA